MSEDKMRGQGFLASWPIRRKLVLLFLCIFLPALGTLTTLGLNDRRDRIHKAKEEALLVVRRLAAQQDRLVAEFRRMLSILADLPQVRRLDVEACNEVFRKMQEQSPYYSHISLAKPDGMLLASSMPFEPGSLSGADRKHFQDVVRTLDFSVGEYVVSRLAQTQSLAYAYPVLDEDRKLIAVVMTGFRLDHYRLYLAEIQLPEDCAVGIVDHRGVRLYRWPESAATLTGSPIPRDILELARGAAEEGTFEYLSADGVLRLYAFKRLSLRKGEPPYLYLFVGQKKSKFVAEANVHLLSYLIALGLGAILSGVLAWLLVDSTVIEPTQALVSAADQLGKGQLSIRTGLPHTSDELGQLARALDDMATLLEARAQERDAALESLHEVNAELENRIAERTAELSVEVGERKAAEALLLQQKGLMERTSRLANVGGWDFDVATMELTWTDETAGIHDLPPGTIATVAEALGFYHGSSREAIERAVQAAMEQAQPYDLELEIITATGAHKWVRAIGQPIEEGDRVVRVEGSIQDITERKQTEEKLEAASLYARSLIEASLDPLVTISPEGKITDVNRATEQVTGVSREHLIHDDFANYFTEPERARQGYRQVLSDGWVRDYPLTIRHVSGRTTDVLYNATLFRNEKGETQGVFAAARDVTTIKRYEQELKEARDVAERANRAKSEFLANMSHEIRTPMNAILGMAQLMERGALSFDQRRLVENIRSAGGSLLGILNDILDFSKIEAGRLQIKRSIFDLMHVLSNVVATTGYLARMKRLDLQLEAPDVLNSPLVGDVLRLNQILVNLVGNAIKFTDRGEIRIRVLLQELTDACAGLRFEVHDTGIGIPPEALADLFNPFTQAESTITRRFGGTGLGLSICKRLVELMGGTIGVESVPGEGSTFWFELTFDRAGEEALPLPSQPGAVPTGPRLQGLRFLAVDDSRMNLDVLERALELEGAEVITAMDGGQALEILRADLQNIDAVLMDVQMPVMDGLSATQAIRLEPGMGDLPVIACTAGVLKEERQEAVEAGVNDFLAKPVDLEKMVEVLMRHVRPRAPAGAPLPVEGKVPGGGTEEGFPAIPGIDQERVRSLSRGDTAFFLNLLRGFVGEATGVPEQVRADLARSARETALDHLHRLRGAAANLGAMNLVHITRQLEDAIREEGPDVVDLLIRFAECRDGLLKAAAPWVAKSPLQQGPVDDVGPPDAEKLAALRSALAEQRLGPAERLFAELLPNLTRLYGADVVQTMAEAMDVLRFNEVLRLLDSRESTEPSR